MEAKDPIVVLFKIVKCIILVLFWGIVSMSLLFKSK